ncbi:MAG: ABC transporter permease [Cytophagales bacterium]|nr:ABC transporter permease [Armatimonadota bacterium]
MGILTENPILAKEMRSRLRSRKQTRANRIATVICVGVVVALLYYGALVSLFDTQSPFRGRDLYGISVVGLQLTLLVLITPSLAAGSITQEREQQTWNALLLSRLTAAEIVGGKYFASLLPLFCLLALFVPIDLIAAFTGEIGLTRFLLSHLLLIATALFYTAISLYFSWVSRRTFVATTASLSTILTLVVGTPVLLGLWQMSMMNRRSDPQDFVPLWLNPYFAMSDLLSTGSLHPAVVGTNLLVSFGGTALLLFRATRRLSKGPKELEQ